MAVRPPLPALPPAPLTLSSGLPTFLAPTHQSEPAPDKTDSTSPQSYLAGSSTASRIGRDAAELMGTFWLVLLGTFAAIIVAAAMPNPRTTSPQLMTGASILGLIVVAAVFALILKVFVNVFGSASGAHFNPDVTVALAVTGDVKRSSVGEYLAMQFLGATLASLFWYLVLPDRLAAVSKLGAALPNPGTDMYGSAIMAFIATALFLTAVMSVAGDDAAEPATAGTTIGTALGLAIFLSAFIGGGAINVARAFGPLLMTALSGGSTPWLHFFVVDVVPLPLAPSRPPLPTATCLSRPLNRPPKMTPPSSHCPR
jgi:glycerol uptake facilitator protein